MISRNDLIREFGRYNFDHVNDLDEKKSMSNDYCDKTRELLEKDRELIAETFRVLSGFSAGDSMEYVQSSIERINILLDSFLKDDAK